MIVGRRTPDVGRRDVKKSGYLDRLLLKVAGTSLVAGFKAAGAETCHQVAGFPVNFEVVKSGRG